ncbi:hypothetical protein AV530_005960 [Patagioenas fasciata monilis]|uniref:Uncharacterized protein n=1 Tax=Patagioenas fasciata monilis TaxID=372326 RepID=A0A1V4JN81_PATFA|nr:hypothetical protein AV530_005960 [Patagioenas fasciata monilis]
MGYSREAVLSEPNIHSDRKLVASQETFSWDETEEEKSSEVTELVVIADQLLLRKSNINSPLLESRICNITAKGNELIVSEGFPSYF